MTTNSVGNESPSRGPGPRRLARRIVGPLRRRLRRASGILGPRPRVLHVDAATPAEGDRADGSSWSRALSDLAEALRRARPGTEIRVAGGTYVPDVPEGETEFKFMLRPRIVLRGGYAGAAGPASGTHDPEKHPTILSGDLGARGRALHVLVGGPQVRDTLVEDVVVEGGSSARFGGGLLAHGGQLRFRRCTFRRCHAYAGAGVFLRRCRAEFEDCLLADNEAVVRGAGAYVVEADSRFVRCRVEDNRTEEGGAGLYFVTGEAVVSECTFHRNRTAGRGGGMTILVGTPLVENCVFTENEAGSGGGCHHDSGVAVLRDCRFERNRAREDGGAILVTNGFPDLERLVIRDNTAGRSDGGIAIVRALPPEVDVEASGNQERSGEARSAGVVGNLGRPGQTGTREENEVGPHGREIPDQSASSVARSHR